MNITPMNNRWIILITVTTNVDDSVDGTQYISCIGDGQYASCISSNPKCCCHITLEKKEITLTHNVAKLTFTLLKNFFIINIYQK